MSFGANEADVKHAVVFDVAVGDHLVEISFMSGEGTVVDMDGEPKDPLLFTMQIHPHDEMTLAMILDVLSDWNDSSDPIDILIKDGDVTLHNSERNFTIQIDAT